MNRLLLAGSLLALSGATFAQSFSPLPKYQSKAGDGYQYVFGTYVDGRYQFADGNFRNSVLVVTKISMRADDLIIYNAWNGMGRGWKNVQLDIGPTELGLMTRNFSTNMQSTPTRCFSGAMAWPTLTGKQGSPLTNYPIQIPMAAPYINTGTGKSDMLMDFRMTGGTLANNGLWATNIGRAYYTDGYVVSSFRRGMQRFWHDTSSAGCKDSAAVPPFTRAYTFQYMDRYSPSFPTLSFRNKVRIYNYTLNVGPSAPFVNVVNLGIDDVGVPFGAGCERLFLKISPTALYYPAVADLRGQGPMNTFGVTNGLVKYDASWKGLEVYTQSAWEDTRTRKVKLSAASSAIMPELGLDSNAAAKRVSVYFNSSKGTIGFLSSFWWSNPIIRYNWHADLMP